MLFFGLCFIASTPIEDLYYGLVRLGLPFPMSFALSLSFRLVPIFSESASAILQAQRSRGLKTSGNPISRFKSYFPLFVPVFLSALRKVDQLSIALEARGFGAGIKRTSFVEFKFSGWDWAVLVFCLLLAAGCVSLRLLGHGFVRF
jgi:energy-coupling factor transport system permease protein